MLIMKKIDKKGIEEAWKVELTGKDAYITNFEAYKKYLFKQVIKGHKGIHVLIPNYKAKIIK